MERIVPLRTVGSSKKVSIFRLLLNVSEHTRDYCQFAPKIGQTDRGDIDAVDDDLSFGGFKKSKERQRQGTLARTRST